MTVIVSSKGRVEIPSELRRQDGIEPGTRFSVERLARGEYQLRLQETRPNAGLVDWLLACPDKGFFAPIESESIARIGHPGGVERG